MSIPSLLLDRSLSELCDQKHRSQCTHRLRLAEGFAVHDAGASGTAEVLNRVAVCSFCLFVGFSVTAAVGDILRLEPAMRARWRPGAL